LYTVEPLITDSLLSGPPLLSGQLAWNRLLSMGLLTYSAREDSAEEYLNGENHAH